MSKELMNNEMDEWMDFWMSKYMSEWRWIKIPLNNHVTK